MKHLRITLFVLVALAFFAGAAWLDEGMWLLDSVNKLPLAEMQKHGLELSPDQIYSASGPSLKDAIVLLGGGTASFISPEGLIITNHHVAFSGIQQLSSVQDDYLKNGFCAKTRSEELPTTYMAEIVRVTRDVTGDVMAATSEGMTVEERTRAIQARIKELEDAVKEDSGEVSKIVEMYSGMRYYLFTSVRLPDVRLVYAPPSAIGDFGGEVDNWQWPRHTGDFSLMRVYTGPKGTPARFSKDNVPFKPLKFLPISTKGYSEGSFAMIMGFPGRTYRYREASSVELARDETLPVTVDLYGARMDIINQASRKDRATEIKYASTMRRLSNTFKKFEGMLDGIRRSDVVSLKRAEEARFTAYLSANPELTRKYGSLLSDLQKASDELRTVERKNLVLASLTSGVNLIRIANRFATFVDTPSRDSLGNILEPTEREVAAVREFVRSTLKDNDRDVDKQTLIALLMKSAEMAPEHQPLVVKEIVDGRSGAERDQKIRGFVDDLYDESSLTTLEGCDALLGKSPRKINNDEAVEFARKLTADQRPIQSKIQNINTSLTRLRENFVQAWMEWKKNDMTYPDANRTLRLTYGKVLPVSPRDAVHLSYETTLTGVIEKESNEDPFIVPAKLKELWKAKDFGRYADTQLRDIPVAFITDNDITGGNSGSPVINGKGELIGCAFDGNWEGIIGDYYFQEENNRTISVDTRYVLFILDKFSGAQHLLNEMVIR